MAYEIFIGIDCAPGDTRPNHISKMIESECGLEVALGPPLFGAASGIVRRQYDTMQDAELDADRIWGVLERLHRQGTIRGAFKDVREVRPAQVNKANASRSAVAGIRRKRRAGGTGESACDRCGRSFRFGYTILGVMAGTVEHVCPDCRPSSGRTPFLRLVDDEEE